MQCSCFFPITSPCPVLGPGPGPASSPVLGPGPGSASSPGPGTGPGRKLVPVFVHVFQPTFTVFSNLTF